MHGATGQNTGAHAKHKNPTRGVRAAARHIVKNPLRRILSRHRWTFARKYNCIPNVDLYTQTCTCTYHMLQDSTLGLYIYDSESFRRLLCEEKKLRRKRTDAVRERPRPPASLPLPVARPRQNRRPDRSRRERREQRRST